MEEQKNILPESGRENPPDGAVKTVIVHRGMTVILILLAVCVCGFLVLAWQVGKISAAVNDIETELGMQILDSQSRMAGQLHESLSRMEQIVNQSQALLVDSSVTFESYENRQVRLSLAATPREYVQGQPLTFVLMGDGGEEVSVSGECRDGSTTYTADARIPLWETLRVKVILEREEGVLENYVLPDEYSPRSNFTLELDCSWFGGASSYRDGAFQFHYSYSVFAYAPDMSGGVLNRMTECRLYVERNSEEVYSRELPVVSSGSSNMYQVDAADVSASLEAAEEDVFDFYVEAKDSSGFTYQKLVNRMVILNGSPSDEYIDKPVRVTED